MTLKICWQNCKPMHWDLNMQIIILAHYSLIDNKCRFRQKHNLVRWKGKESSIKKSGLWLLTLWTLPHCVPIGIRRDISVCPVPSSKHAWGLPVAYTRPLNSWQWKISFQIKVATKLLEDFGGVVCKEFIMHYTHSVIK